MASALFLLSESSRAFFDRYTSDPGGRPRQQLAPRKLSGKSRYARCSNWQHMEDSFEIMAPCRVLRLIHCTGDDDYQGGHPTEKLNFGNNALH